MIDWLGQHEALVVETPEGSCLALSNGRISGIIRCKN
jgi:hypothetical protein